MPTFTVPHNILYICHFKLCFLTFVKEMFGALAPDATPVSH